MPRKTRSDKGKKRPIKVTKFSMKEGFKKGSRRHEPKGIEWPKRKKGRSLF